MRSLTTKNTEITKIFVKLDGIERFPAKKMGHFRERAALLRGLRALRGAIAA